jgi:hypothetical protein
MLAPPAAMLLQLTAATVNRMGPSRNRQLDGPLSNHTSVQA